MGPMTAGPCDEKPLGKDMIEIMIALFVFSSQDQEEMRVLRNKIWGTLVFTKDFMSPSFSENPR